MVDAKRIGYLLGLALILGLALVFSRTRHMQRVCEMTCLVEQEQQLQQEIWEQRVRLSTEMESPEQLRQRVQLLDLDLCPRGGQAGEGVRLAKHQQ